jgi:hypothetical protein
MTRRNEGQEHHILFSRNQWRANLSTRRLRNLPMLRPPIDAESHRELHKEYAVVPVPCHFMADRVERYFKPVEGDYMKSLDNLIAAFDEAAHYHKTRALERQVGELIVHALEVQRPYIEDGLWLPMAA